MERQSVKRIQMRAGLKDIPRGARGIEVGSRNIGNTKLIIVDLSYEKAGGKLATYRHELTQEQYDRCVNVIT
jgi:hypothetical protein